MEVYIHEGVSGAKERNVLGPSVRRVRAKDFVDDAGGEETGERDGEEHPTHLRPKTGETCFDGSAGPVLMVQNRREDTGEDSDLNVGGKERSEGRRSARFSLSH